LFPPPFLILLFLTRFPVPILSPLGLFAEVPLVLLFFPVTVPLFLPDSPRRIRGSWLVHPFSPVGTGRFSEFTTHKYFVLSQVQSCPKSRPAPPLPFSPAPIPPFPLLDYRNLISLISQGNRKRIFKVGLRDVTWFHVLFSPFPIQFHSSLILLLPFLWWGLFFCPDGRPQKLSQGFPTGEIFSLFSPNLFLFPKEEIFGHAPSWFFFSAERFLSPVPVRSASFWVYLFLPLCPSLLMNSPTLSFS